jgi:AAA15 family ATPase/GTPase
MFNKETKLKYDEIILPDSFNDFQLNIWISENDMSEEENINNPNFYITGGYLKTVEYKEAWKNLWNSIEKEEKQKYKELRERNRKVAKKGWETRRKKNDR